MYKVFFFLFCPLKLAVARCTRSEIRGVASSRPLTRTRDPTKLLEEEERKETVNVCNSPERVYSRLIHSDRKLLEKRRRRGVNALWSHVGQLDAMYILFLWRNFFCVLSEVAKGHQLVWKSYPNGLPFGRTCVSIEINFSYRMSFRWLAGYGVARGFLLLSTIWFYVTRCKYWRFH